MEVDGSFEFMTKKEVIRLTREKEKLLKNIGGIKDLETLPDMIFIIDPKKEAIAVAEAMRLKVPIVAIIDTNCNPDGINFPIPGNDDAIRAINLFSAIVSSAVVEGQNEAGKMEVAEDTQIVSLEEEEQARAERERAAQERALQEGAEDVEDYLSDEELEGTGDKAPAAEAAVADEKGKAEGSAEPSEEKPAKEAVEAAAPPDAAAKAEAEAEKSDDDAAATAAATAAALAEAEPAATEPVATEPVAEAEPEASKTTEEEPAAAVDADAPSEEEAPDKKQEKDAVEAGEQGESDTANETPEPETADTDDSGTDKVATDEAEDASDKKQDQ
jgi:hypothetical protein